VKGGGAVSFVEPFSPADGTAFYRDQVRPAVRDGEGMPIPSDRVCRPKSSGHKQFDDIGACSRDNTSAR
jgi:hypothetical protein